MKKIFKIIYYAFLACLAAIALLLVFSIFPVTGNYKVLVVQSGSMEPTIKTGAIVVVKPAAEYKVGDIITFQTGKNKNITHRVHEVKTENNVLAYVTKGDANNAPDQNSVSRGQILGKVLFSLPYAGYAVDVAKKPYGFAALVIFPAAIIVIDELRKIFRQIKKIKEEKQASAEEKTE